MEKASGVRQHHVSKLHLQPPLGWVCITTTKRLGCGSVRLAVAHFIVNGSCVEKGGLCRWVDMQLISQVDTASGDF